MKAKKQYRAKAKGFCGVKLRDKGEIFEFEGQPGPWMELIEVQSEQSGMDAEEQKSEKSLKRKAGKEAVAPKAEKPTGDADVI